MPAGQSINAVKPHCAGRTELHLYISKTQFPPQGAQKYWRDSRAGLMNSTDCVWGRGLYFCHPSTLLDLDTVWLLATINFCPYMGTFEDATVQLELVCVLGLFPHGSAIKWKPQCCCRNQSSTATAVLQEASFTIFSHPNRCSSSFLSSPSGNVSHFYLLKSVIDILMMPLYRYANCYENKDIHKGPWCYEGRVSGCHMDSNREMAAVADLGKSRLSSPLGRQPAMLCCDLPWNNTTKLKLG